MESPDQIRKAIRSILEDHGIMDKDKLEHIPEAITVYISQKQLLYRNGNEQTETRSS